MLKRKIRLYIKFRFIFLLLRNNVSKTGCAETSRFFGASSREFSRVPQEEAKRFSVRGKHRIVSHRQAILALRLLLDSQRLSSWYMASRF